MDSQIIQQRLQKRRIKRILLFLIMCAAATTTTAHAFQEDEDEDEDEDEEEADEEDEEESALAAPAGHSPHTAPNISNLWKRTFEELGDDIEGDDETPTRAEKRRKVSKDAIELHGTSKREHARAPNAATLQDINMALKDAIDKIKNLDTEADTIIDSIVRKAQMHIMRQARLKPEGKAIMVEVLSYKLKAATYLNMDDDEDFRQEWIKDRLEEASKKPKPGLYNEVI